MVKVYPIEREKIPVVRKKISKGTFAKRNELLFDFMLGVPLRISDVLGLRVMDIRHKDTLTIIPSKSKRKGKDGIKSIGRRMDYYIHPQLQQKINEFTKDMDDLDYVFKSREGENKPISRQQARNIIKTAAIEAGIEDPIACHSIRKTHGTISYEKYGIAFAMEQLGHKDPTSIMSYLHLTDKRKKERISNLDLYD